MSDSYFMSSTPTPPPNPFTESAGPLLRALSLKHIPDAGSYHYEIYEPPTTPTDLIAATSAAQQRQLEYEQRETHAKTRLAANLPPDTTVGRTVGGVNSAPTMLSAAAGSPEQRAFRPYGCAPIAMYDRSPMVGISGAAGTGKALDMTTPIPTPSGWRTMETLQIGDQVFDEQGLPTTITAVSPIMYDHECFTVTTADGVSIVADAEHEWTVFDLSNRNWKTITTQDMKDRLLFSGAQRTRWAIPTTEPVQYPQATLPIHPYLLGVWLGDGSKRDNTITCHDPDIIANIIELGYGITSPPSSNGTIFGIQTLGRSLRELSLKDNKHIPSVYLTASVEQRLALVQGLMDTDGSASTRQGDCNFLNKNEGLVRDFASLLWSLGIKANIKPKQAKMKRDDGTVYECQVHQVAFTTSLPVFKLDRKSALQNKTVRSTQDMRYVTSVEPTDSVPVRCIKVDSPLSLFLAGPQYLVTHNSRLFLEKVHLCMEKYPGARALIVRKTRESLSEAALYTFEEKVLPVGHPALPGPQRSHRQNYHYPNGSMIVVCGLDKPQKIMSTEYDMAYGQELSECDISDVEMLMTRLRNGVMPYQQFLFDTNPDKPTHWIWQRSQAGKFPLHPSYHEDNPTLWEEAPPELQALARQINPPSARATYDWPLVSPDGRIGRYTPAGLAYLAKLDNLTGARYKRLRLGQWVSAEGGVYEEEWNTDIHLIDPFTPPSIWRRFWSLDFGYTAPLCWQKWALDSDGRMYNYYEIYHTKLMVEDACKQILADSGWSYHIDTGHTATRPDPDPLPEVIVCDTDAEGVAVVEAKTGLRTVMAYKGVSDGIQGVKSRLRKAGDDLPRIFFCRSAVAELDPELKDKAKPQSTIEEFDGYIWDTRPGTALKKGEKPLGIDDHGMDTTKYAVCYIDDIREQVKADDVAQAAGVYGCMVQAVPSNRHRHTSDDQHGPGVRVLTREQDNIRQRDEKGRGHGDTYTVQQRTALATRGFRVPDWGGKTRGKN